MIGIVECLPSAVDIISAVHIASVRAGAHVVIPADWDIPVLVVFRVVAANVPHAALVQVFAKHARPVVCKVSQRISERHRLKSVVHRCVHVHAIVTQMHFAEVL